MVMPNQGFYEFTLMIGQRVYHVFSSDGVAGVIVGISSSCNGQVVMVSWGDRTTTEHYPLELTTEKPTDYGTTEEEDEA